MKARLHCLGEIGKKMIEIGIIFAMLLMIVNWIPDSWISENMIDSKDQIEEQFLKKDLLSSDVLDKNVNWDNLNEERLRKQLDTMEVDEDKSSIVNSLDDPGARVFWLGSKLFLRPLFVMESLERVHWYLLGMLLLISVCLTVVIERKEGIVIAGIFAIYLVTMDLITLAMNLELIGTFYVMLCSCIWIQFKRERREIDFLYIGALACFVDQMGIPVIMLVMPMFFFAWKEKVVKYWKIIAYWFTGLTGSVMMKLILGSYVTGSNLFAACLKEEKLQIYSDHALWGHIVAMFAAAGSKYLKTDAVQHLAFMILTVICVLAAIYFNTKKSRRDLSFIKFWIIAIMLLILQIVIAGCFIETQIQDMVYIFHTIVCITALCAIGLVEMKRAKGEQNE